MKIFNGRLKQVWMIAAAAIIMSSCNTKEDIVSDDITLPENYGILEVDFKLPVYKSIPNGIRRVDLAVCYTMAEMYHGTFFYRCNVSDAKEIYQIYLPEGRYFYQAIITCTCGGDSCMLAGYPVGYGFQKYAFDQADIVRGQITRSQPTFK